MRWESKTTGKSGYAPACANEWRAGVCGKPRIKCADCGHCSLIPLSDAAIYAHLAGDHTIGVYAHPAGHRLARRRRIRPSAARHHGLGDARQSVSWKRALQLYTVRLHREHAGKASVQIIDFVDTGHPALLRMWDKRQRGYRAMSYPIRADGGAEGTVETELPLGGAIQTRNQQ